MTQDKLNKIRDEILQGKTVEGWSHTAHKPKAGAADIETLASSQELWERKDGKGLWHKRPSMGEGSQSEPTPTTATTTAAPEPPES